MLLNPKIQLLAQIFGNELSPIQHQTINWINADLLSIRHLGINFSEI